MKVTPTQKDNSRKKKPSVRDKFRDKLKFTEFSL